MRSNHFDHDCVTPKPAANQVTVRIMVWVKVHLRPGDIIPRSAVTKGQRGYKLTSIKYTASYQSVSYTSSLSN